MKTTVELSDALMAELKARARNENTTMREAMETAIRRYLDSFEHSGKGYRLRNNSFRGSGVCERIDEGSWEQLRGIVYEGRGDWSQLTRIFSSIRIGKTPPFTRTPSMR